MVAPLCVAYIYLMFTMTMAAGLNLLEEPTQGDITLDNISMIEHRKDIDSLRRKTGMAFQQLNLFPNLTVIVNITLAPEKALRTPPEKAREDARVLLKRVGLEEKENEYPNRLSGGQKQRVAIARARPFRYLMPRRNREPRLSLVKYCRRKKCRQQS